MTTPPRRTPPDDDQPNELRTLIHKVCVPAPLDPATRARLRRRLVGATLPKQPPTKRRGWHHSSTGTALVALATFLVWSLLRRNVDTPIALPEPDHATAQPPAQSRDSSLAPELLSDPANRRTSVPPREEPGAHWYSVWNRCSDAVCRREPACCAGAWNTLCDDVLLDAARLNNSFSGGVGRCYYHDREQCPECFCDYYLKVGNSKTDAIGYDQGTGCLQDREALLSALKTQCAEAVCE